MDLLGRKMRKGNGALFMTWLERVQHRAREGAKATHKLDEEVSGAGACA